MRLRQLCCHRELIKKDGWDEILEDHGSTENGTNTDLMKRLVPQLRQMIKSGVADECSVCLGDLKEPVITPCAHVFCRACIERVLDTTDLPACPFCRSKVDGKKQLLDAGRDYESEEADENTLADLEDFKVDVSSSKVNAVITEMLRI